MDKTPAQVIKTFSARNECMLSHQICEDCAYKDDTDCCNAMMQDVENLLRDCYSKPTGTKDTPKKPALEPDNVNHPSHYETGKFECIDVMTETPGRDAVYEFCVCNAFKYLYRHRRKNNAEDIKKAIWYLNKALELSGEDK